VDEKLPIIEDDDSDDETTTTTNGEGKGEVIDVGVEVDDKPTNGAADSKDVETNAHVSSFITPHPSPSLGFIIVVA
jgi:hypothetical protein